jgi:hypothetical protein
MRRTSTFLPTLLAALVATIASTTTAAALAQEEAPEPMYRAETVPWEARIGYRGSFVESPGYGPFSNNDYLPMFTLAASRLIFARGPFAFTAGAAWDYGETGATARGADTSLTVHRLTAPLAVHLAVVRWFDVIATVAPGAQYQGAKIEESSALAPLVASSWVPCGDASLGVSWGFGSTRLGPIPLVLRLTAEGGYAWAAPMSLAMTPDLPGGSTQAVGTTDLGTLSMNGAFGRIGVAAAF